MPPVVRSVEELDTCCCAAAADYHLCFRTVMTSRIGRKGWRISIPRKKLCHAEIGEDDMTIVREEDICGFDVPMYDAMRMQNLEGTNQLGSVEARKRNGHATAAKVKIIL